jgi:ectoine hydroxylase-related dioxygenase (phytanoyl-CoA dioxygenase family)
MASASTILPNHKGSSMTSALSDAIDRNGFAIIERRAEPTVLDELQVGLPTAEAQAGLRNILTNQLRVRELARSQPIRAAAEAILGPGCFAVRGILFDKTPDANWKVAWHQDLTIAVRERQSVDGFTAWSIKDNVLHVQPPTWILERMVALRLHLDDCRQENGPLRVLPGSHRYGRLDSSAIDRWKASVPEVQCVVERGGLVLMRPLLLHASSAAEDARHRRILHLEFAEDDLPGGLEWFDRC